MKKMALFAVFLLAAFASAQTREVFVLATQQNGGIDRNYPWTDYYASDRFVIRYSEDLAHDAFVTQTTATNALNSLERAYDSLVNNFGFYPPFHPGANTRFKSEVIVTRGRNNTSGVTEWADGGGAAYGGLIGSFSSGGPNSTERPIQWIGSGLSHTTLTHEFVHGLQQMAGGMRSNNADHFVGWFHESHAQFLTSKVHGGNTGIRNTEVTMRQAHLHTGYARSRYQNWTFLEHFYNVKGMDFINNIWTESPGRNDNARHATDPFWEAARTNDMTWEEFGDLFGDFAMKSVIYDYGARKANFRSEYNGTGVSEINKYQRFTFLEALDPEDMSAANNRFVSPHAFAPQRLAFNIIRLYPDTPGGTVTVRFRGDVQTENNRRNYAQQSGFDLEPRAMFVHDNPGSDWRYGLVAVRGQATSTSASVTARYSDLMRAINDGELTQPDVSMTMQSGETELYLVVAATPTENHRLRWDQYHYTIYRFPYMVEINGASPEGFQENTTAGRTHSNGGGFIANSVSNVPASVYVGPHARILGGTVSGNARIEGRAVVMGGTVRGNAIIRDYATVRGGTVEGDAIVSDGAVVWGGTIDQNARVHGSSFVTGNNTRVRGTAQVGGVTIFSGGTLSGTAQALGDGAGSLTASSGIFFAANNGSSGDPRGADRTTVPVEFTMPLSRTWYGDATETVPVISTAPVVARNAGTFRFDNRGNLQYNLGGANSATLKVFNSQGRVIRTMALSGAQTTANIGVNTASQMLLWRVETNGKTIGSGRLGMVR